MQTQGVSTPVLPIGKLIETELRRQGKSVTWFSQQLHCARRNVYSIFDRDNIDTTLLMRISRILDFDFFSAFSYQLQLADIKYFTPPRKTQIDDLLHYRQNLNARH